MKRLKEIKRRKKILEKFKKNTGLEPKFLKEEFEYLMIEMNEFSIILYSFFQNIWNKHNQTEPSETSSLEVLAEIALGAFNLV